MSNPYTNPNATLSGAASDQELGRQTRERQMADEAARQVVTTIDQDINRVYGQGGLAGMARDEQIKAVNQQKNDIAQAILMGNPNEAAAATNWAMENGILTETELQGVVQARQMQEEQARPRMNVPQERRLTPEEDAWMAQNMPVADTAPAGFAEMVAK